MSQASTYYSEKLFLGRKRLVAIYNIYFTLLYFTLGIVPRKNVVNSAEEYAFLRGRIIIPPRKNFYRVFKDIIKPTFLRND